MSTRPLAWADPGTAGLAVGLGALAVHALSHLVPIPAGLDTVARLIAYVGLPGWAAARRLPGRAGRRTWETAVIGLGLGAALAGFAAVAARAAGWPADAPALGLAIVALALLAPRSSELIASAAAESHQARTVVQPAPSGSAQPRTRS
jgi:multisubunit Na+/H+ antiporter MnhG subunit